MPINNHSVLLKGVNDNLGTMRSLLQADCCKASRFARTTCSIATP